VRAMKISAATQLRSGTRRGTRREVEVVELAAAAGCAARRLPLARSRPDGEPRVILDAWHGEPLL
jgi:hypothetical protein